MQWTPRVVGSLASQPSAALTFPRSLWGRGSTFPHVMQIPNTLSFVHSSL